MEWLVTIGPAKPGDAASLGRFLDQQGVPLLGLEDCLDDCIVARDDGQPVGVVAFERGDGAVFLRSLAVRPSHRGRGLGRRLLREALERAMRHGFSRVWLLAASHEELFRSLGFRDRDRADFPEGFPQQEALASSVCASRPLMLLDLRPR